jgi:hypothetical protein
MAQNKQSPQTPAPREHAKGGSLTNMPTPAQIAAFEKDVKPGLIADIRKNWGNVVRKARSLNGSIRYHDKA